LRSGVREKQEIEKSFDEKRRILVEGADTVRTQLRTPKQISKDIAAALAQRNKERNLGIVRLETSQRYNALKRELKEVDDLSTSFSSGPSKKGASRPLADQLRTLEKELSNRLKRSRYGENKAKTALRRALQHRQKQRRKERMRKHRGASYLRRAEKRKRKFGLTRVRAVKGRRRRAPP